MNEISEKIYNILIAKAKEVVEQGFFNSQDHGIPEIMVKYSDIPEKYWKECNVLDTIEHLHYSKTTDGHDFDALNVVTSICSSSARQIMKIRLNHSIWEQLLKGENKTE